ALHAAAVDLVSNYDWGDLFEPPSLRGTVVNPGIGGGGNWGGASFDPETGTLYVTSLGSLPFLVRLQSGGASDLWFADPSILNGPSGIFNLFKPPFATITAYDLARGEIRWRVPNSGTTGVVGHASSLVTKTLLFSETRSAAKLTAFDKGTGERVAEIPLPANASGAPMTYMAGGRQHVVVAVGSGAQQTMELVALRLPRAAVGAPGAVRFTSSSASARESDGAATISVTRQGGRDGRVTVEVVPAGGTATAGADFESGAHVLEWNDGEGGAKQVGLRILDDDVEEGHEVVTLELRQPTGGLALAAPTTAQVMIGDDDVAPCVADAHTLCVRGGRFRVRADFRTAQLDGHGRATALSADAGYFTFFEEGNVEVLVKVHDACVAPFERFWVFAAGLTDVEVTLTVADTERDVVRRYDNPLGRAFPAIQDTGAFDCSLRE
ncbi:MAG TPA: Calx-beta domain-containing protein, partial [Thermoanaerobaculia bacterium]|nr:Calx-beta domain-containing protein [Thermoanaerobaculia bacterium]